MEEITANRTLSLGSSGAAVMRLILAVSCALPLLVLPASAQEAYPDLRGTWTGIVEHVILNLDRTGATFSSGPIELVVSEQRDRRFVGEIDVLLGNQRLKLELVGIFTSETEFAWTETEGIVNGRMIDDDTFEACYLRVSAYSQVAACETMTRQD